jgi:hypothetical protein
MNTTKRYSPEVREHAVRLVFEHETEYESQWAAIGVDCGEDWVHCGDPAQMGAAGRA